jgi:hypothetical protein
MPLTFDSHQWGIYVLVWLRTVKLTMVAVDLRSLLPPKFRRSGVGYPGFLDDRLYTLLL